MSSQFCELHDPSYDEEMVMLCEEAEFIFDSSAEFEDKETEEQEIELCGDAENKMKRYSSPLLPLPNIRPYPDDSQIERSFSISPSPSHYSPSPSHYSPIAYDEIMKYEDSLFGIKGRWSQYEDTEPIIIDLCSP